MSQLIINCRPSMQQVQQVVNFSLETLYFFMRVVKLQKLGLFGY